ncbi:MAG: hypothetical protein JJ863_33545 [Deltaproteobacteria bacterium]|nr:hypothetical protein [Deltaproteobacteria bacterium]
MRALALLLLLALACGPSEEEAPAAAEPQEAEPAEPEEAEPLAEEPEEDEPLPALGEQELDDMDQPALEAACFQGSTAACDRLGH